MEPVDGFQLAQRIHHFRKYSTVNKLTQLATKFKLAKACPVIAATAFRGATINEQALKVGIETVLHKPVSMEQFNDLMA